LTHLKDGDENPMSLKKGLQRLEETSLPKTAKIRREKN